MAEENRNAVAGQEGAAGSQPTTEQGTGASTQAPDAGGAGEKTITLTERELRARLDKEIQKALQTRTANLEKERAALEEKIKELQRRLEEAGLSQEEKLKARESEIQKLQSALKELRKAQEAVNQEIEAMVEAELAGLSEEDRMLVDAMFDANTPPLAKLRAIRALRNAGRIGAKPANEEKTTGNVGNPLRPGGTPQGSDKVTRLAELGRRLAKARTGGGEAAYVPPEWEGK